MPYRLNAFSSWLRPKYFVKIPASGIRRSGTGTSLCGKPVGATATACCNHLRADPEMFGQLVHRQLRVRTSRTLQQHCSVVPQGWLLGFVRHGHAMSKIFAVRVSQHSRFKPVTVMRRGVAVTMMDTRHDARVNHGIEQLRSHQDLRDATAQISLSSCCGVDSSDHMGREHQGTPELVGHETGSCVTGKDVPHCVTP